MERVQASSFLMLSYLLAVQSFVPGQHRLGKGGEGKRKAKGRGEIGGVLG